jgi:hypothetical protein
MANWESEMVCSASQACSAIGSLARLFSILARRWLQRIGNEPDSILVNTGAPMSTTLCSLSGLLRVMRKC